MDKLKRWIKENPIYAVAIGIGAAHAVAAVMESTAHIIGSSGYAIHASKRKKNS
ncbi:MAG: hypothetical protein BWY50_01868 [Spirochaetes bacterium ADurb.Bin315]|nr:MAG: hypothetical protein BWY50_01868 [Spirochaetes bacterium ADurb.Bin315]